MEELIETYRRNFKARQQRLHQEREAKRQKALQAAQATIPPVASHYPSLLLVITSMFFTAYLRTFLDSLRLFLATKSKVSHNGMPNYYIVPK
jgi:hypothetical protein